MHTTTTLLALTGATLALANPAPAPLVTPAPVLHPVAARLGARQFDDPVFSNLNSADLSKSLECARQYASLANEVPRESNRALATWLLTAAAVQNLVTAATAIDNSLTTLCDPSITATLTPPASLSSAWSTYQSKATSWVSSAAPEAHSIASSCGGEISAAAELLVISDSESCTKAVVGIVAALNGEEGVTTASSGTVTTGTVTTGTASRTTGAGGSETGSAGGDGDSQTGAGGSGNTGAAGNGATQTTSTSTGGVPRETGMMGVVAAAAVAVAGVVAAL